MGFFERFVDLCGFSSEPGGRFGQFQGSVLGKPHSPGPLGIGPGPKSLPLPIGAQRALFASDGYDSYATHAAEPDLTNTKHPVIFFLPAPREAGDVNDLLSGHFRALRGARMAKDGRGAPVPVVSTGAQRVLSRGGTRR